MCTIHLCLRLDSVDFQEEFSYIRVDPTVAEPLAMCPETQSCLHTLPETTASLRVGPYV